MGEGSLLDALRDQLGVVSPKDGCSPQGQCGCCTVWVDGAPRVSCVTPVARVTGRRVTTLEGLPDAEAWANGFAACGASQCGFCTPGIIMRLAGLERDELANDETVRRSLLAHLCRCTGWQPILDAAARIADPESASAEGGSGAADDASDDDRPDHDRPDHDRANLRAAIEGGVAQRVGVETILGNGGFADDEHPDGALVALRSSDGGWQLAGSLADARRAIGKIQGRRTTTEIDWPVDLPDGEFERTLQTTWLEPGYLEPDASWCEPGREPASPLGNGGAFGAKASSPVADVAAELSQRHDAAVRVLYSREDVVRNGPKRPPLAIGMHRDGSGVVRIATTGGRLDGIEALQGRWPQLRFEPVEVPGPPVSLALRSAVEAELHAVTASFQPGPEFEVTAANGARAWAAMTGDVIAVRVDCGDPLDEVVLRSYCTGAAHMALGMVTSEAIRLGVDGTPADLTIRSFGIVRAVDTPTISVEIVPSAGAAVNGSDAVFAAVAAAVWSHHGLTPRWPTGATSR